MSKALSAEGEVWRLISLVSLLRTRCQFSCLRAVDELKATVPMVAQDEWTCVSEHLAK